MRTSFYDTDRAVAEYLHFHYGEETLPYQDAPAGALHFPLCCVTECLNQKALPPGARALDLGCAVGRSSFELARSCQEVVGIDWSQRFIDTARHLQDHGHLQYTVVQEGLLTQPALARIAPEIDRQRVRFQRGDAEQLPADLGTFDVVLLANLIDRLHDPRRCLRQLPALLKAGGQLIITSPYTWLTEYTPVENWLGGFERKGRPVLTLDTLREVLSPTFSLTGLRDLPFLIREHARKFQWSVAQASLWLRHQ